MDKCKLEDKCIVLMFRVKLSLSNLCMQHCCWIQHWSAVILFSHLHSWVFISPLPLFDSALHLCNYWINYTKPSQHPPQISAQPVYRGYGNTSAGHQPSHQDEPGGAVIEGVLAIAEDVRALFGASIWAGVVHKCFIVNQVRHLALALIRHLCDLRVGGGKGRRRCTISQVLIDTTVEDGGAERVGSLGTVVKMKER